MHFRNTDVSWPFDLFRHHCYDNMYTGFTFFFQYLFIREKAFQGAGERISEHLQLYYSTCENQTVARPQSSTMLCPCLPKKRKLKSDLYFYSFFLKILGHWNSLHFANSLLLLIGNIKITFLTTAVPYQWLFIGTTWAQRPPLSWAVSWLLCGSSFSYPTGKAHLVINNFWNSDQ